MVSKISVRTANRDEVAILVADGVLDSSTYRGLRDHIVKAALDEPRAVMVDISGLRVPAASTYAVFTSARWQVSRWPNVPVLLVCGHSAGREMCAATASPAMCRCTTALTPRWRCSTGAPIGCASAAPRNWMRHIRRRVGDRLAVGLGQGDMIRAATVIATELVDKVVAHTDSEPVLRVETDGATVTIAMSDHGAALPALIETTYDTFRLSGLRVIAALADAWGCVESIDGKTVWATMWTSN
jgi:hypothetical protein